jgi:hypothetical protein
MTTPHNSEWLAWAGSFCIEPRPMAIPADTRPAWRYRHRTAYVALTEWGWVLAAGFALLGLLSGMAWLVTFMWATWGRP